jgi:hypothetical protein
MAFTAIVAIAEYSAVAEGVVAATTLAEVGAAMSVVGAVTKDPTISKLGGAMAIGGGVAGMTGAGLAGEGVGSSLAGEASAYDSAVPWSEASSNAAPVSSLASDALTADAPVENINTDSTALNQDTTPVAPPPIEQSAPVDTSSQAPTQAPTQAAVTDVVDTTDPSRTTNVNTPAGSTQSGNQGIKPDETKGNSFFNTAWEFIKKPENKYLVNNGTQLIGGVLQGINSGHQFDRTQGLKEDQFAYEKQLNANVSNQNKSRSGILNKARF